MSPIACYIMGWPVHWYGLAYAVGIIIAWAFSRFCIKKQKIAHVSVDMPDRALNGLILGIIVGGRLGHVFFYDLEMLKDPQKIWYLWQGGMSFHGGLLGVMCVSWWYAHRFKVPLLSFYDMWAVAAPIGLFFGRLANFVNQELYGRITTQPWGVIFSRIDNQIRHPSQLYEAFTEGIILWAILVWGTWYRKWGKIPGKISGYFLVGYAIARWICEYYREPEEIWAHYGTWMITMGQAYSIPVLLTGIIFLLRTTHIYASSK